VRALWDFVAGGSHVTPTGIAAALALVALGNRLGWNGAALASLYCATLVATLAAAAFERS
jgi:hypothetical protein